MEPDQIEDILARCLDGEPADGMKERVLSRAAQELRAPSPRGVWRKWLGVGAAGLAVVVPVQSIRTVTAGADLEQRLTQLREHGEPIALSELAPQYIPDDENAATYYRKAFEKLKCPENSTILRTYILPETSESQRAELGPEVRELIRQNEAVFPLVRRGAEHPDCLFIVDLQAVSGADWSHIFRLQTVVGLLAARATLEARDPDMDSAVDDLLTTFKVARAADADPLGMSFIAAAESKIQSPRRLAQRCMLDITHV